MPTKRMDSTMVMAMQIVIAYSMAFTGMPCVRAKSRSNAEQTIWRYRQANSTHSPTVNAAVQAIYVADTVRMLPNR